MREVKLGKTSRLRPRRGEGVIRDSFTISERERFRHLLTLAAESPFEGERANALAAAGRLAARHGMTLAEAADRPDVSAWPEAPPQPPPADDDRWTAAEMARFVHLMDWQIHAAKAQRDAALRAARMRGLDADTPPESPKPRARLGRSWRDPRDHARILLTETSLRLHEIVEITGLDIYQVVGFKLKLWRGL